MPPLALEVPPLLVLTGNESGKEESQVTELVRSLTKGTVEYVPMARNCPVSCKSPTVIAFGMIVSESRGSGAGVRVTVTDAVADKTDPSELVNTAVIVVAPAPR